MPIPTSASFRRTVISLQASQSYAVNKGPSGARYGHVSTDSESLSVGVSRVLGSIRRLKIPGEEDDSSFLGSMGVPTFAADETVGEELLSLAVTDQTSSQRLGLEGALQGLGPSFVVPNALDATACETLIQELETMVGFGDYESGKNNHGAMQIVVSPQIADQVAHQLSHHIDISQVEALRKEMLKQSEEGDRSSSEQDVRLGFVGLNRRWRIYRYQSSSDQTFAPHIDAGFPPSGISQDGNYLEWDCTTAADNTDDKVVSRLTVLMYLNEDFQGGETNFYQPLSECFDRSEPGIIASVRPRTGSILVFPQGVGEAAVDHARQHWPLHEGSPVLSGRPKYVIRSDALFVTQNMDNGVVNGDDEDYKLFQYDHAVRQTLLPQSQAMNSVFLSHAASLYNPHMGVENLGPLLYSFIRFTKLKRVVEIGAGYTSLWILQALKDNDLERSRIQELEGLGQNRLLDIEFTIPQSTKESQIASSLLCIDNCLHQKETATGALTVAKTLGLDSYMEFQKGDAFEIPLPPESVDVLWCDFGVGSGIQKFVEGGAWDSIAPGGFLLCHSTLTNEGTRSWLERVRARRPKEETGLDPNEFVELSLLEPHKRYQNSITLLQKRKDYSEPIYSQFA
jgi:hypothetical protein